MTRQSGQIVNTWLDVTLLLGFPVAVVLGLIDAQRGGGVIAHEWLGLLLGVMMGAHLFLHRRWLVRGAQALIRGKLRPRLSGVVSTLLLLLLALIVLSGVAISQTLGLGASSAWIGLHHGATKLAVIVVIWHVVLQRRQLLAAVRRYLLRREGAVDAAMGAPEGS